MTQVSFRLLSQAMLIARVKKDLDREYEGKRGEIEEHLNQKYVAYISKLHEEIAPKYKALEHELELLWDEIQKETGVGDHKSYALMEDGHLTPVNVLTGDLN